MPWKFLQVFLTKHYHNRRLASFLGKPYLVKAILPLVHFSLKNFAKIIAAVIVIRYALSAPSAAVA
jgi:hypothetical protein